MTSNIQTSTDDLMTEIKSVDWYHTLDLGNGILTPGHYDHRPYLNNYKLPKQLDGKTVLDVGAASGYFSFELERRGAQVTATDLPTWFEHDFGPNYQPDQTPESGQIYLHQPFEIAKRALNSNVQRRLINIYDLAPETVGLFDMVFCGSLLIHLTDPAKALWRIASVTKEKAIIATVVSPTESHRPIATMIGQGRGDGWWIPTRACLELMVVSAGFLGIEWVSDFRLDYRDGSPGPYHGVLHAYKTTDGWSAQTISSEKILEREHQDALLPLNDVTTPEQERAALWAEVKRLNTLVNNYEQGRFIRLMRWLSKYF